MGNPMARHPRNENREAKTPTSKKSVTVTHGVPLESSKLIAFMFGNEEMGRHIPPLHMRQAAMTKVRGRGSGSCDPI